MIIEHGSNFIKAVRVFGLNELPIQRIHKMNTKNPRLNDKKIERTDLLEIVTSNSKGN
jgi:hypothetical protein